MGSLMWVLQGGTRCYVHITHTYTYGRAPACLKQVAVGLSTACVHSDATAVINILGSCSLAGRIGT